MSMCLFVYVLFTVFTVMFCAHIILFDGNFVCFCPVYLLLPQERRRRLSYLPVCMDWHVVFRASSGDIHFIFFISFFVHTYESCTMSM